MIGQHVGHIHYVGHPEMLQDVFVRCVELIAQVEASLQDLTGVVLRDEGLRVKD